MIGSDASAGGRATRTPLDLIAATERAPPMTNIDAGEASTTTSASRGSSKAPKWRLGSASAVRLSEQNRLQQTSKGRHDVRSRNMVPMWRLWIIPAAIPTCSKVGQTTRLWAARDAGSSASPPPLWSDCWLAMRWATIAHQRGQSRQPPRRQHLRTGCPRPLPSSGRRSLKPVRRARCSTATACSWAYRSRTRQPRSSTSQESEPASRYPGSTRSRLGSERAVRSEDRRYRLTPQRCPQERRPGSR
jgi:hypothetical protein